MTSPLLAPNSAGMASPLARDYAVQIDVNYGTELAGTPDWQFVLGLNKVSPTNDITFQDDGDIHSNGRKSQVATAIGENLELAGLRKGTLSPDFVPNPGIEKLRWHGQQIGYLNTAHIRYWRTDGIDEAKEGYFATNFVSSADDKEGLLAFTATLTGQGQHLDIVKPTAQTVKTFTLPAGTSGGVWDVAIDAGNLADLAWNVPLATFKSSIEGLANVLGTVTVTGTPGEVYTVVFATDHPTTVTANGADLTGGSPTVAVS